MKIEQIRNLDETELSMALFIVNKLSPVSGIKEIPEMGLTWFKPGALEKRLVSAFNNVKPEFHGVYSSMLNKLGIQHEIKYETPAPTTTPESHASGSV